MKQVAVPVFILMFFLANATLADGKSSYMLCVACHGADGAGNVALNSPAIAGQESWYVERQLKNFKSGLRGTHKDDLYGMQMRPMAMVLADDTAVSEVATYVAEMAVASIEHTVGGDAAAGKAQYMICATCHGPDAKGLQNMNSPDLTLQQDWYLVRQIQNFKSGVRGADMKDVFGMQMRPMAMVLPNEQAIKDVVAYIATLRN